MKSFKIKPPTYLLIAIFLIVILRFTLPIMTSDPATVDSAWCHSARPGYHHQCQCRSNFS